MHESAQTSSAMPVSCMSFDVATVLSLPTGAPSRGDAVADAQARPKRAVAASGDADLDRADVPTFVIE